VKTGVLTPEVCKANAALVLNFLLPLLMFSTVVPAFEPENMKVVLALLITAAAYMTFGLAFGFIVKAVTPVPRGWSGGVLATGP
jgi:predicted permease